MKLLGLAMLCSTLGLTSGGALGGQPAEPVPGAIGRRISAAEPGATIVLEPGVYREHVRIDRPLRLIGRPGAILDGGGAGDIVEIAAPDVEVSGLVIRNTGVDLDKENAAIRVLAPRAVISDNVLEDILFGIDVREAPGSILRNNAIGGKALDIARRGDGLRLWRSDNCLVENNRIHDGRDAILWYSTGVSIRNNTSTRCRYGLHLMFSDSVSIEANHLEENSVGVYLMYSTGVKIRDNTFLRNRGPSGYGIGLKETDRFEATGNVLVGNRVGVYLDGSPFTNAQPGVFSGNTLACNDTGVLMLPSARGNEFSGNNFIDNIQQICVAGRGSIEANRFWKDDRGNFWSDYTGFDLNRDGVGDFVHEPGTLFDSLLEREPKLRLFLFSPAQQAVELVGRAVPAVNPERSFADEVPLMAPVPIRPVDAVRSGASWASGLVLLSLGVGLSVMAIRAPIGGWTCGGRP